MKTILQRLAFYSLAALCTLFASNMVAASPALGPWPASVVEGAGFVNLSASGRVFAQDAGLLPLATVLSDEIHRCTTVRMPSSPSGPAAASDIVIRLDNTIAADEGYRLTVGPAGIVVEGKTYRGVAWGTSTLLQSIETGNGNPTRVPYQTVNDQPVGQYRGLLIDVARQWHPVESMRPIIEMCRLYKINYLQLHLNDQQSTVFPFLAYPQLASTVSGQRRTWTRQEVLDLVKFADDRGVTLVPELEGPGHHAGNLRSLWGRGGTIDVFNEATYTGFAVMFGELASVFASSPYIHIGADEAGLGHLGDTAEEQTYMATQGITGNPLSHYITRLNTIVKSLGKQTICWEGFSNSGGGSGVPNLPTDILVMPFESTYNPPNNLVNRGFSVINTAWRPLYVVNNRNWPADYIYDSWNMWLWEHHVNLNLHIQIDRNDPVLGPRVRGAQMCAWEQAASVELPSTRVRLHAMGERTWSPDAQKTYADFATRAEHTDALLDRMLGIVDVQATGTTGEDRGYELFSTPLTISLSAPAIGSIRYTINGSAPTIDSPLYTAPITLSGSDTKFEKLFYNKQTGNYGAEGYVAHLQARIFDTAGHAIGDVVTLKNYWYIGAEISIAASGLSGESEGDVEKFLTPITVALTPAGPGVIRYTLNGGEPSVSSPVYTDPLQLTKDHCIVQGILWSRASAKYTKFVPAVVLRARLFSAAGVALPGLTAKATYWNTDPTLPQPDDQAPTEPTAVIATAQSANSIAITWTASTDNIGVTAYDVFRGATLIGSPVGTSFTDTGLTPDTPYSYTVKARDAAGKMSAASAAATATTFPEVPDTEAPSVPNNVVATAQSGRTVMLIWAPSTDNRGVTGYEVYRNGVLVGSPATPAYLDSGLSPSTLCQYTIKALDAAGNPSGPSTPAVQVTTLIVDTTPPSVPSGVVATALSNSAVSIQWTASTDNRIVAGYEVSRDGEPVTTVATTSFTDSDLTAATAYVYTVKAFDGDGNFSAASAPVEATTLETVPILMGESFDYTPGTKLNNLNGGLGWGGPWIVNAHADYPASVEAGNLGTYPALGYAGQHLKFWSKSNGTVFANLDRGFAATIEDEGQTLWFAMMVSLNGSKEAATWNLSGLSTDVAGTADAALFQLTSNSTPTALKFGGITLFSGDTNSTPHLVVVKIVMSGDAGSETLTAYTDPNLATDPAFWTGITRTGLYANDGLLGISYRGGRNSSSIESVIRMDEIRIGLTWQAATGKTNAPPDTIAPSIPANVVATAQSSSILVTWNASTDNTAVTAYDVYRGATLVGSPVTTSFTDTGLTASTLYSYTVKAKDAAGNTSDASAGASATTQTETVQSLVLAEETFDSYTAGSDISGKSGGTGWTSNWTVTKAGMDTVVAGNADGSGTGNCLAQSYNATTPQASRSFAPVSNATTRTLWLAFELQASAVKSTQTLNLTGTGFTGNMITIGTGGSWVPPTYQFYGATVVTPATTAAQLFVIQLDIVSGGNTTMSCYVNPNLTAGVATWTPAAVSTQAITSVSGISLRSNNNSASQTDKVKLDNIRLATTWQGAVGQSASTPIETWRQAKFGSTANIGNAADAADPNHNGISNLLEYALGGDPTGNTTGTGILPQAERGAGNELQFRFTRHLDRSDLKLTVQAADSLSGPWSDVASSTAGGVFAPALRAAETGTGNTRSVVVTDLYPIGDPAHPKRFMRLKTEK
jgi:N-acetyl-beta-hexosaminidase/chitodextrinase